jgi:hypothetical protein
MLSRSSSYLLLLSISIILISCHRNNKPEPEIRIVNTYAPVNFVKEVPIEKKGLLKGQEDLLYQFINKDASKLYLDSLETGYDSLQIRIWLGHSMASEKQIVILKFTDNKWKAQLLTFTEENEDYNKTTKNITPKSGWSKFIKNLFDLSILTLPDEEDLPGYNGCGADGIEYHFEWATTKKYRFYSYCNPEGNVNKFWQARNVLEISRMLEKELNFEYTK